MSNLISPSDLPKSVQEAIKDFFSYYDLEAAEQMIWAITRAALCSEDFETGKDREPVATFGEHILTLIKALHHAKG